MKFEHRDIYHVYNQGNNHQSIFKKNADYERFIDLCNSYVIPYCNMVSWCLLPNHFHFMLEANEKCNESFKQGGLMLDPLTNGFRKLLSTYSHQFNKEYDRSGSLFRPKTKSKNLSIIPPVYFPQHDYYLNCLCYIHQNPVRHKLVTSLDTWPFSSYHFYAGLRANDFCSIDAARRICNYSPETFVKLMHENVPGEFVSLFAGIT